VIQFKYLKEKKLIILMRLIVNLTIAIITILINKKKPPGKLIPIKIPKD
tara:strand:+ start:1502 stop:1648 length:147 start_codon:yes stop_codon:yes gene_type:complete